MNTDCLKALNEHKQYEARQFTALFLHLNKVRHTHFGQHWVLSKVGTQAIIDDMKCVQDRFVGSLEFGRLCVQKLQS